MSTEKAEFSSHGGIDFEAIPGNVHLVDIEKNKNKEDGKIVLVPTPSDDPDDPLNWELKRKLLALSCCLVYTLGVGVPSAAIYSVLNDVSLKTGISLSQLNNATGYLFLFYGIGCFAFQPLALQYGKRPVYCFLCLQQPWSVFGLHTQRLRVNGLGLRWFKGSLDQLLNLCPKLQLVTCFLSTRDPLVWLLMV